MANDATDFSSRALMRHCAKVVIKDILSHPYAHADNHPDMLGLVALISVFMSDGRRIPEYFMRYAAKTYGVDLFSHPAMTEYQRLAQMEDPDSFTKWHSINIRPVTGGTGFLLETWVSDDPPTPYAARNPRISTYLCRNVEELIPRVLHYLRTSFFFLSG